MPQLVDGVEIDYMKLAASHHRESMRLYFEHRMPPGSGLSAILSNDLRAVVMVDEDTFKALPHIYRWMVNYAPSDAWGSHEKVRNWLNGERNAAVHPTLRPIVNRCAPFVSPEFERLNAAAKEGL